MAVATPIQDYDHLKTIREANEYKPTQISPMIAKAYPSYRDQEMRNMGIGFNSSEEL
jgi:hypothetical protein